MTDKLNFVDEVQQHLADTNKGNYNYGKLAEELMELGEVCLKILNKKPEKAPPVEKLSEEMGDVVFRMGVLIKQICKQHPDFDTQLDDRILKKAIQLKGYADENKYYGGL